MNSVALPLTLIGYGIAIPVLLRWTSVPRRYRSIALTGHQFAVLLAATAWVLRGRTYIALAHLFWLVGARLFLGRTTR